MQKLKKTAIIPARSGSKGLKDKNITDLCSKPLIAYSIEAALKSGEFEKVIVSTDSEKYSDISKKYGADVLIRPNELAQDSTPTFDVAKDFIEKTKEINADYFVLLQPTSPLRNANHIKEAIELFEQNYDKFDFLSSVTKAHHPAVLVHPLGENNSMKYFDIDYSKYRRQNYKDYTPNGAIYIAKIKEYLIQKHFYGAKSIAYIMDEISSVDIDNIIDLELVKIIKEKYIND